MIGRRPTGRGVLAVATAAALGLGAVVVNPAKASSAPSLSPGQVVTLSSPGVSEMHPGDGRLGGYGFMADVTGVAFAAKAGAGDETEAAAPGDQLVVVSLTERDQDRSVYYAYNSESSPSYSLVAGKERVPLPPPGGPLPPYSITWAVAVPTGSPAELVASRAGFSQRFDLRLGHRAGVSPAALYRADDAPELDESIRATQTLTANGGPGGDVSIPLALTGVALAYFKPGASLAPPPPAGKGWLIVDSGAPTIIGPSGDPVLFPGYFRGPNIELKTAAGVVQPVVLSDPSESPFAQMYAFEVPASITAATFVVDLNGHAPVTYADQSYTLRFNHQQADFPVSFPSATPRFQGYLPTVKPKAHRAPTTRPAAISHPSAKASSGSSAAVVVVVLVAVVLFAGLGLVLAMRRRTFVAVRSVQRRPSLLLNSGPALALIAPGLPGLPAAALDEEPERFEAAVATEERPVEGEPIAETEPEVLVVSLLGPLKVEGLRQPIKRTGVMRLLVALALYNSEGPVTVEHLRDLVAKDPDHPEPTERVHELASRLRVCVPDGALPAIGPGAAGYRLGPEVEVDWVVFSQLQDSAEGATGHAKVQLGLSALSLVRGKPLANGSWAGVDDLLRPMETAIENLAADTARTALECRDARAAETAVARGLEAIKQSPRLWELRLVAAAAGSGFGLERAWAECQKELKADASLLEPTYRKLRQGDF